MIALLSACLAWGLGFLVVRAAWPAELRGNTLALRWCLALPIGGGVVSLVYFANLLLLGSAHAGQVFASEATLLVVLAAVNRRGERAVPMRAESPGRAGSLANGMLLFVAVAAAASFLTATLASPHGVADAMGIWNLRAHLLFDSGTGWRRATAEASLHHLDYPMLVPILIARAWLFGGAASPGAAAAVAFAFTFATAGVLWGTLRAVRGPMSGNAAAAVLLAFPAWIAAGASQYADLPLSCYFLSTMALLVLHDAAPRADRRLLLLAGLSLALAAWTKNEGLLFAVAVVVVRAIAAGRLGWATAWRDVLAMAVGAAPAVAALAVFKIALVPANDLVAQVAAGNVWSRATDGGRWLETARGLVDAAWSLGPVMLMLSLGWFVWCRRERLWQPLIVASVVLCGYFATYVGTSVNLSWHLGTSSQRLLLQLAPTVLLAVFSGRTAGTGITSSPASACSARS